MLVACQKVESQMTGELMTGDGSHKFTYVFGLPATWEGKIAVNNLEHAFSIHYDAEPKALLFTVTVMTDAEWEQAKNEVGAGEVLKTIDGVVFVINMGLDNPYIGSQGDEFQSLAAQIHDVIGTLSIKPIR
jgi:hypothetical protein